MELVSSLLAGIRLEVNQSKTGLTSFDQGFTFLGVTFEGSKYRYEWRGRRVEAQDQGESFPLDLDGYR